MRGCLGKAELDLHTIIWTRGSAFPLTSLEARLKCPMCGSRKVSVIFDVPSVPAAMRIRRNAELLTMPLLRNHGDDFEIRVRAMCRWCGKTRELGPDELLGAADMDAFKELERRFRCSDCGERRSSIEPRGEWLARV